MAARPAPPVRLSERRGSIGVVILLAVSLGIFGAQTASGAPDPQPGPDSAADAAVRS